VLDDQAKAAQMYNVSDVLQKMIQICKQTSGFSTAQIKDIPLADFLTAICKYLDHRAEIWVKDFIISTFLAR
jgi:hypothetical protein